MDELRDKVAWEILGLVGESPKHSEALEAADAILALPEIAEALDALAERRVDGMSPGQFGAAIKNG